MTNYNDQDDKGYDDGNKDINYDNTFASRSGSDGPIFDPIAMPWSRRGESGDRRRRYDCGALYIYPLKMGHKLLYAEFGVFNWCCCHTKKTVQ